MNKVDYKTAYENVMIANKMLEQENKQLKDSIDKYENEVLKDCEEKIEIIQQLQQQNINLKTSIDEGQEIIIELQQRIDKAIEYIKTCNDKEKLESMFLDENYISNYGAKELLEILGDKENE